MVLVRGGVVSRRFEVPKLETVGAAGWQPVHEPEPVSVAFHGVLALFEVHAELNEFHLVSSTSSHI